MKQYLMAEKARLFGDTITQSKIMRTDDPSLHKSLGRSVRGFESAVWDTHREDITLTGNYAKVSQNPDMLSQLLATGDQR